MEKNTGEENTSHVNERKYTWIYIPNQGLITQVNRRENRWNERITGNNTGG